ncbi:Arrestin red cell isoform 1 [Liparis tanakae]|uniref:Arrestin red cell isoform 1 n=1 Tax=Liparis tanakae TaxID=230148 RepID=A0A4Z2FZ90_9TELE|nr:Arrestin red cell isoform 1 [Liparis tanakae]
MGDKAGTSYFLFGQEVTVYLGKRDFVDHLDHVDPVDGVILVDPEYLKDRKVFVTLTCAFRYGREDLDVLGLSFRKDLYISTFQAFPPVPEEKKPNSRLQERLLKKLGQQAHPFYFTELGASRHQEGSVRAGEAGASTHVRQYADICLFSTAQYKCPVAQLEADDQVSSSSTFCKVYTLTPTLDKNREKRGLALDGKLKHEDTNLASSTIVKDVTNKEVLGILVSYRVKVKLVISRGGDVSVELPFILMHPKPVEPPLSRPDSAVPEMDPPIDTNLIEFDTNSVSQDDDFVFEDFARLRLKGAVDDKDEDC